MNSARDNIPPTHPRRIALLADCPDRTLKHESDEVRRLVTAYRAIRDRQNEQRSPRLCRRCGQKWQPDTNNTLCPVCESPDTIKL